MKKLLVLAMMATLLMAGSAFAINRNLAPVANATFNFPAQPGSSSGPTTTNNDDSCDIGVAPAATLLLPYFEVDLVNRTTTTLFTITNVSRLPQIAHVTIWTDRSLAVLDFNIYLTGYDVQSINMADVLISGLVAQPQGTGPTTAQSPIGSLSAGFPGGSGTYPASLNPNFNQNAPINCGTLPGLIPQTLMALVRSALTTGVYGSCASAGDVHTNAIGYATIDVAASCTTALPSDGQASYFGVAGGILYDNVLIGDYQQLGPAAAGSGSAPFLDAAGNAMVHIRAVPEGGPANGVQLPTPTNLPYTFYDRYTTGGAQPRTIDRRQPLPSTWAARWIQGGTGAFATNFKIWREGFNPTNSCSNYAINGRALLPVTEIVRFDEHENPYIGATNVNCSPNCGPGTITLPETSATNTTDTSVYPPMTGADVGGWMYLNLHNGATGGLNNYSVTRGTSVPQSQVGGSSNLDTPRPSQNWVIVEMFGNLGTNHLSVDFDAAWLGNGCSPAVAVSTANSGGTAIIGPAGGVLVCPAGNSVCAPLSSNYPGTNTTPLP